MKEAFFTLLRPREWLLWLVAVAFVLVNTGQLAADRANDWVILTVATGWGNLAVQAVILVAAHPHRVTNKLLGDVMDLHERALQLHVAARTRILQVEVKQ